MSRIDLKLDYEAIRRRIDKEKEKFKRGEFTKALGINPKIVTNVHGEGQQKPSIEYIVAVAKATNKPVEYYLYGQAYGEPPGSTIGRGLIAEHRRKYDVLEWPFKDKDLGQALMSGLAFIEEADPEKYRGLVERIAGAVFYLRYIRR